MKTALLTITLLGLFLTACAPQSNSFDSCMYYCGQKWTADHNIMCGSSPCRFLTPENATLRDSYCYEECKLTSTGSVGK